MRAKKKYGQNFLIDNSIISKIANTILLNENDLVIEIGAGTGNLTKELKKKHPFLICYELDTDLACYLNKLLDDKTTVIYRDILNVNLKEDIKNIKYDNLYIVGNLPYYITTPIIKHLIDEELNAKKMVFMVQDEVANRFTAEPNSKEYGSMTLYLKYFFNVHKEFKVSKNSFNPIPKVESAIISFTKRDNIPDVDKEKYFKLINDSFKMKRKTLKNNLNGYDYKTIQKVLQKFNLPDTVRAEELREEVFIDILKNL